MIEVNRLQVEGNVALGLRVDLPESPPLIAVIGEKGFVMCGFLNIDTAERIGAAAALVSGVKTIDDVLGAEIKAVTSKAENRGVKLGMKGRDAVKLLI